MLLLGLLLCHHEPWRDEIQAWLLARDAHTPLELWRNTRYEGHPLLWHFFLWIVTRFSVNPLAMQALHWMVASAGSWVFLRHAPFPLWVRLGWILSYFPLYEYGAVSRNYGLTLLFLLVSVASANRPRRATAALVLASHASPMGILLAPFLAFTLPGMRREPRPQTWALLAAGWGMAVWSCLPPPDYEHARGVMLGWDSFRAYYVLRGVAFSFLPLLKPEQHFWNNPMLLPFHPSASPMAFPLALLLVAGAGLLVVLALWRAKTVLLGWSLGFFALVGFFYVKVPGAARHHGFLLVWSILCLWLAPEWPPKVHARRLFLAATLTAGLEASLVAAVMDWKLPFSAGKEIAAPTRAACSGITIVGHPDWAASTVAGYLPGWSLFYPAANRFGSFVIWNLARAQGEGMPEEQLIRTALRLGRPEGACLLLNRPLASAGPCQLVAASPTAIVADEAYWLYGCTPDSK